MVIMNKLSTEKRAAVVRCLVDGCSIRATCRITGVAKNTVVKLLVDLGEACQAFHDRSVKGVQSKSLQMDEQWAFVGSKEKNTPPERKAEGRGDVWTWVCIDRDTKLVVSWLTGDHGADEADWFVHDVRERTVGHVQITTDNLNRYRIPIQEAFGREAAYARMHKVYMTDRRNPDTKYSPAQCIGCHVQVMQGDPDPALITTSHVERVNLTTRMNMRRMTRLTNAFSKKLDNLRHAMALHFVYYNYCRVHMTLKMTPAQASGLADKAMKIEDLIGFLDSN